MIQINISRARLQQIAKTMRGLREKMEFSQKAVAANIGVGPIFYNLVEEGIFRLNAAQQWAFASLVGSNKKNIFGIRYEEDSRC